MNMSAAGRSPGRLHERDKAPARRAFTQVRAAADSDLLRGSGERKVAARSGAPCGCSAAAPAASVEVH
jgi:hypothetical protein